MGGVHLASRSSWFVRVSNTYTRQTSGVTRSPGIRPCISSPLYVSVQGVATSILVALFDRMRTIRIRTCMYIAVYTHGIVLFHCERIQIREASRLYVYVAVVVPRGGCLRNRVRLNPPRLTYLPVLLSR